jgi:hypothetical protein
VIRRLQVDDPQLARLRAAVRTDSRVRAGAFVAIAGILTAIALLLSPPASVTYDVGAVADRVIRAPRSVSFVSESLTEAEREKAAAAVPKEFKRDPGVVTNSSTRLTSAVTAIGKIRTDATQNREQKIAALTRLADVVAINPQIAADIADMSPQEWEALAAGLDSALRTLYVQGIRPEQLAGLKADAVTALPTGWTDRQKRVGAEIVTQNLNVNVAEDEAATSLAQQDARNAVTPVQVQVTAGEAVVRQDQVVGALEVEKLRALGLSKEETDWRGAVGLLMWAGLIAGVLALFVERYATEAWLDDRKMILVVLSLLALTVAGRSLASGPLLVYFAPFAAVAMMLTVLVGGRTALATQIAGALHVGVMTSQVELVAYVLVPALLGMAAVVRATTAREFAFGALAVAAGNVGVILVFVLLGRTADPLGIAQLLAGALVSGLASGLLAFAGMAILGHVFGIPTVFELRELSDPNHPLLRQLLLRTPGTYHHSLLVANLAERAAEVIGADPLVARVGAYYHDIGKMRNPTAFIENQTGGNPHDELDPLVSAGIVAAHIKDGLALADRYRLPAQIREMIPGHHGTSVVKYFFQLAQQRGQAPDERSFRYPGPRPRSKEAGIVMLADGTEASVRSLSEKNPETIRGMVDKIIDERVADAQLDECDLTFRDLGKIKEAFCELLLGVYHERIPYPEDRITPIKPAASG